MSAPSHADRRGAARPPAARAHRLARALLALACLGGCGGSAIDVGVVAEPDGGVCPPDGGECIECVADGECRDPSRPRCDPATHRCVVCLGEADCPAGTVCRDQTCRVACGTTHPCPAPLSCCDGACADLAGDALQCGACGHACAAGLACCDGTCTDPSSDFANCGGCGQACVYANADAACEAGTCRLAACRGTFRDCNGAAADGCETDTAADADHCGGCDHACAAAHAVPSCADAVQGPVCRFVCLDGFGDCNADMTDGCESDLSTDPAHCAACGVSCARPHATGACAAGACSIAACDAGFADCNDLDADGCEVSVAGDPANCGGCGEACGIGADSCVAGACRCGVAAACGPGFECRGGGCVACGSDAASARATCKELLQACPVGSGVYFLDPDGPGGIAPFGAFCEMTTAGGGWTLVARELSNQAGNLKYLGVDTGNDAAIAGGTGSGVIGRRFSGKWSEMWVQWGTSWARFSFDPPLDAFANAVDLHVPLAAFTTSDATLSGWVAAAGGAVFCASSRSPDVRPGDTAWAFKPASDNETACGCNGANWLGRGAYYGGVADSPTSCGTWGGGFAGVKDTGQQKGGVVTGGETRIYVR